MVKVFERSHLLKLRCTHWKDPVRSMDDKRIPKDIPYAEPSNGKRKTRPEQLLLRKFNKIPYRLLITNRATWENTTPDRLQWQQSIRSELLTETKINKQRGSISTSSASLGQTGTCNICSYVCLSLTKLCSYRR